MVNYCEGRCDVLRKINFEINNLLNLGDSEDPKFCNVELSLFSSGDNAHHLYVSEDTLKNCANSAYNIPIVWKYDSWSDDIGGHSPTEVPCGFIFENNNPMRFNVLNDGRVMLVLLGKIWKRYSGKLMSILKRDGGEKAVSVEMDIDDFDEENKEIKNFSFNAVTLLGSSPPAIPDAKALVLSFSKDKDEYYKTFESSDKKTYKIDLSKESAYMEDIAWKNEGRKLYGKMLSAQNAEALVNACYLIVEEGWRDSPSTKLKYPVCKWRGDTLCLARSGLEAANSRMQAQGVKGTAFDKLKKYYKRLSLSGESFSTDFQEKEESKLEDKVMMQEPEEEKKFEVEKPAPESEPEKEEENTEEKEEDFACKFAEAEKQLAEYAAKFAAQEEELNNLRKYKSEKEESEKNYAIEQTMSEVAEYLPKDEAEKFRAEAAEVKFSEVESFKNKIKARSLDFATKITNAATNRMAIVQETTEKKDKWGW